MKKVFQGVCTMYDTKFRPPDPVGTSIGTLLGCFVFVGVPEGTISRLPLFPQVPIRFPKKWGIAYTGSKSLNLG